MKLLKLFLSPAVFILLSIHTILAQEKFTFNGYVKDAKDGETFIGASIRVKELPTIGTFSNTYGFYALSIPKGNYTLLISYLGYETIEKSVVSDKNQTINFELQKATIIKKEIKITAQRKDEQVKNTQMGQIELTTEQIKNMPAIFGEVDILKSLQTLPGVQSAGEGQTGFYVRGGGPDQNLILLDNATVYNTGHLFGFFSVFNPDAIKSTTLIKGGMPANYGGRLSSVVDINMKEGNSKEFKGSGGIGLIASRLTLEGPWKKNKGSFMISGRRTYIDALAKPFAKKGSALSGSGYYFYDFNAKINYKFSDKDRIFLSGYFGRDVFNFTAPSGRLKINMPWGNSTATLRWNHLFSKKLFANTSIIYNDYQFQTKFSQNNLEFGYFSGMKDGNAKIDFDYFANSKHNIKFGANYTYHYFNPSAVSAKLGDLEIKPSDAYKKYAHEAALYFLDDWDATQKLKINMGLRYSLFSQVGPYQTETLNSNREPIDTTYFAKGKIVKTYAGLNGFEPRITARYELSNTSSVKAAYSHNNQFIHLVSNNGTTLPTDIWVPSTLLVKPQISDQYAVGYFKNFKRNMYETSVEVYYKQMKNQIEYREFYIPTGLGDVEKDFVYGKGESYGAEFFINKQYGKLTGWVGYTLAYTNRFFSQLNNAEKFPAKYDRRHDVNIVLGYELTEKWKFGGTWVYATGNAITAPQALYTIEGTIAEQFTKLNGFRIPAYHRADISATYTPKHIKKRRIEGSWTFSVYNIYSRFNPYIIYIDNEGSFNGGTAKISAKQIALFPYPLPSVTWNFNF